VHTQTDTQSAENIISAIRFVHSEKITVFYTVVIVIPST